MRSTHWIVMGILVVGLPVLAAPVATTQPSAGALPADSAARVDAMIERGLDYLKTQQKPDGGWQGEKDPPAITAIVLKAFVQDADHSAKDPFLSKGFDKLLSYQNQSGGIYKDLLANYNTAIAVSALVAAKQPEYQYEIDKAVEYLQSLQWTDRTAAGPKGETVANASNPWYGGWGYGNKGRPDGSNLQLALDALFEAGVDCTDPSFQAAMQFVTRMQNLSQTNDQPWAGTDGGFVYTPANNGESMAGVYEDEDGDRRLRSYGSMTYAGLKSMIYAGLHQEDPRVKAAWEWIRRNWTLQENPGMRAGDPAKAQHGLFYYYHTFAKALNAAEEPIVTDAQGRQHDWRLELIEQLASMQRKDGSWIGVERWMEDNPVLVTAYAVLALQEAQKDLAEHPPVFLE